MAKEQAKGNRQAARTKIKSNLLDFLMSSGLLFLAVGGSVLRLLPADNAVSSPKLPAAVTPAAPKEMMTLKLVKWS